MALMALLKNVFQEVLSPLVIYFRFSPLAVCFTLRTSRILNSHKILYAFVWNIISKGLQWIVEKLKRSLKRNLNLKFRNISSVLDPDYPLKVCWTNQSASIIFVNRKNQKRHRLNQISRSTIKYFFFYFKFKYSSVNYLWNRYRKF